VHVIYHYEGDLSQDQWRALGWPDLPTDGTAYYVGAAIPVKGFDTAPADMAFEGWHCSDPSLTVAPNGQFTAPRMRMARTLSSISTDAGHPLCRRISR
jgi:hypothetical protein